MKSFAPHPVILIMLLILATGCRHAGEKSGQLSVEDSIKRADSISALARIENDLTGAAAAYADSILATLTLPQKSGMMLMPATYTSTDPATMSTILSYVKDMKVGGIVLLKGSLSAADIIADSIYTVAPDGIFIAVDAENGLKMRFNDAPEFPWNRDLGRLTDDQIMYEFGREIARECRVVGINMVLGPVIDVVPGDNYSGIMRMRSLGSDPRAVADLAIAYAKGIEEGKVISVAKHFPGHGSANADSHKTLGEVKASRARIDSIDLYPFRRYIQEDLSGVMVGHLSVGALDSIRRPAVISPIIMKDILRRQLGFKGLIITDAINMEGAMGIKAWQAIEAGADMVIAPRNTRYELDEIVAAVESGKLSESVIDDRCRRILFYRYLYAVRRQNRAEEGYDVKSRVNENAPALQDSIKILLRK